MNEPISSSNLKTPFCIIKISIFLRLNVLGPGSSLRTSSVETLKLCEDPFYISCQIADISSDILGKKNILLPGNLKLKFKNKVPGNENAYNYEGDGSSLIVTYNPASGGMSGTAFTEDGRTFVLENIGEEGHLWKEMDSEKIENLKTGRTGNRAMGPPKIDYVMPNHSNVNRQMDYAYYAYENTEDNDTMAYISVKVYYTREFARETNNVNDFVDKMLAITNQGFLNSKVPITVVKNCIEAADLNDIYDIRKQLAAFMKLKRSYGEIKDTADSATLLTMKNDACGIGNLYGFYNDAFTVVGKHCVEHFAYGHELGHNLGAFHNIQEGANPEYSFGHGSLMEKAKHGENGYQSIMSYPTYQFRRRANYYSNPKVILPQNGKPTGVDGETNNAAVLLGNRFRIANVGDESWKCALVCNSERCSQKEKPRTKPWWAQY